MSQDLLSVDEQNEIACLIDDGEEEGLRRLLGAYGERVKQILRKKLGDVLTDDDIESVISLAAFRAFKAKHPFDDRLGTLGGWFYRIAYFAAVDLVRGAVRRDDFSQLVLEWDPSVDGRTPASLDDDECDPAVEDILSCVESLGEMQRRIVKADLMAGGEADTDELSRKMGIPKQGIHSYRYKAKQALLKRMEARGYTADSDGRRR